MHSTACGVSATATNATSVSLPPPPATDGHKMMHEDPMNTMPLKSSGLDDEEKNGGEFIHDTAAAEEARRREQMRVNILRWMKKLTIGIICFIGLALITYVIVSLCFSDWSRTTTHSNSTLTTTEAPIPEPTPAQSIQAITSPPSSPSPPTQPPSPPPPPSSTSSTFTTAQAPSTSSTASNSPSSPTDNPINDSVSIADENEETTTPTAPSSSSSSSSSSLNERDSTSWDGSTQTATSPKSAGFMLKDKPYTDEKFISKLGVYEKAAVCSDKEICSQIGSHILEQGGSAVDGAIATLLCNGLVTIQSMGIGGGMLMNVYIKDQKHAFAIDAREVAPFAADPSMFDHDLTRSIHGGLSIAVPGELMGYARAHERFGKLPWKTLVEPSLKICQDGFYMSLHLFNSLNIKKQHIKNNTVITDVFLNSATGEPYPVGTKLQPPKQLCATYKLLSDNGPMDFYNGTLAKLVAEDLHDLGSNIVPYDLESYTADLVSSITMQLGNDTLYALPPISSGTVVASILSTLEGYNFTSEDMKGTQNQARTIHRIAEALKFGYAKRWELGDLRFNDVRELVSKLTNPEHNMEIRKQINDSYVQPLIQSYGAQFSGHDDVGTSHVSLVAPNGDAVSVTSSVNDYFGAGQAGKRTGIVFNSGMNDFSVAGQPNMFGLPPAPSNYIDARKRPMSSMSPMILADPEGEVRLVLGSAGGAKIISSIVQIVTRVLWMGQNIKEAIDAPRFHHQLLPDTLQFEYNRFDEVVLELLEKHGQHTKPYKDTGSVACGIVRNQTALYANADYRKRGGVAGF